MKTKLKFAGRAINVVQAMMAARETLIELEGQESYDDSIRTLTNYKPTQRAEVVFEEREVDEYELAEAGL